MRSCLYRGDVMHLRLRPRRHDFSYRFTSWYLDLDELDLLDRELPGFGHNRPALFSFRDRDFGPGNRDDLKGFVCGLLAEAGFEGISRVCLLCQPRCLGYVFNSLSVYFCYDSNDRLRATLYEVSNTFGERHLYLVAADEQRPLKQQARKALYVSPFMEMECRYRFRLHPPEQAFRLLILQDDAEGTLFQARWRGERSALTPMALVRAALRPPMTLKTILAIHWEALRLWLKRTPLVAHTPTTRFAVSRGATGWQQEEI